MIKVYYWLLYFYYKKMNKISSAKKIVSLLDHFKKLNHKQFNPVLITDIDGVLVRGSNPIQTTLSALHKIT